MSAALLPVYLTAAGLLAASAVAKLRRPDPAAEALAELGFPSSRRLVHAASTIELVTAALMVAAPELGRPAGSLLYASFALLVLVQLLRGSTRSCGCLGSAHLPPARSHLALNVLFAACCAAAPGNPLAVFAHPLAGAVVVLSGAVCTWALAAGLALLPAAFGAYRRPAA